MEPGADEASFAAGQRAFFVERAVELRAQIGAEIELRFQPRDLVAGAEGTRTVPAGMTASPT